MPSHVPCDVGLNQEPSIRDGHGMHVNRVAMIWGDTQDRDLLEYYRALSQARRQSALAEGEIA